MSRRFAERSIQNTGEEAEPLLDDDDGDYAEHVSSRFRAPLDTYHLSYVSYVVFGLAALLPWNMFITANSYFQKKFNNGSNIIEDKFESFFAASSQITNVIFVLVNVPLQNRFSAWSRIMTTLVLMLAMFILTTVMVKVPTDTWSNGFFGLTIITIILFNACAGVFSGGIFGMAASFTPRHTQGCMTGQGIGGLFASVASIISLAVTDGKDPIGSGFYYFLSASIVIAIALAIYPIFLNLKISKFYLNQVTDELSHSFIAPNTSAILITKKIKWMLFSVWFTFLVTLSVFPSVMSDIHSTSSSDTAFFKTYFTPVTCFLLFNFMDFLGRTMAGWFQLLNRRWLVMCSVARVVFIPLFLMCNCRPEHRSLPVWFDHDAYPVIFTTFFAFSNGYFASLAMMYGPGLVPSGPEQATAGACMAFGLTLGLMMGACLSIGVVELV